MTTPLWKTVLAWGAVVTFLSLPLFILAVQLYNWTHPGWMIADPERVDRLREFLGEFMRNITILVLGLAGLRTWEQIKANGNGKLDNSDRKKA